MHTLTKQNELKFEIHVDLVNFFRLRLQDFLDSVFDFENWK